MSQQGETTTTIRSASFVFFVLFRDSPVCVLQLSMLRNGSMVGQLGRCGQRDEKMGRKCQDLERWNFMGSWPTSAWVRTFYTFYQPFPQYHQAALQLLGSGENRQGQNSVVMEIYIYHVTPLCGWNQTTLWLEPSVTPSRSLDPRVRSWLGALSCKIRLTVSLTQSHLKTGKNGMSYYYHSDLTHP